MLNVGRRISSYAKNLASSSKSQLSNAASSPMAGAGTQVADSVIDAISPVARGALNFLDKFSSPKALIGVGAAAGLMGASSVAGPAAMDAAMTTAFGDSNVDRYFMGSDTSARFMAGSLMGGPMGTALALTSPSDFLGTHQPDLGPALPMATTGALGAAGAGIGLAAGSGVKGRIAGAFAGGALGSIAGAGAGIYPTYKYASENREFLRSSPYSTSRSNALALNADGNIVLGMHNSRRSY
jgi:hypothetical protein